MKRREFLMLAGSIATAVGGPASAQTATPKVGFLHIQTPEAAATYIAAFRAGLAEGGFVDGRNIVIEPRWANGDLAKLASLAGELVQSQVAVIAVGGPPAIRAVMATNTKIPIVFSSGEDPVTAGFVASLARPGGNATGMSFLGAALAAKRLDLVRELLPNVNLIAIIATRSTEGAAQALQTQDAARMMGKQLLVLEADTGPEADAAFERAARDNAGAVLIATNPLIYRTTVELVALATKYRMPVIHFDRRYPEAGGLSSYGASIPDGYRQVGLYTARILKGDKPADLPVLQPTRFEFVINLKTAVAQGLTVPSSLLARADEVIE